MDAERETQAHAANDRGDHESARALFLEAYRLNAKPKYLLSAANMCLKTGAFTEAKQFYEQLDAMPQLTAKLKQVVATKLADERLTPRAAPAPPAPPPPQLSAAASTAARDRRHVAGGGGDRRGGGRRRRRRRRRVPRGRSGRRLSLIHI